MLRVFRADSSMVVVAWPISSARFDLQQNTALATNNWNTVTNSAQATNGEYRVTVSPAAGNRFFRLIGR